MESVAVLLPPTLSSRVDRRQWAHSLRPYISTAAPERHGEVCGAEQRSKLRDEFLVNLCNAEKRRPRYSCTGFCKWHICIREQLAQMLQYGRRIRRHSVRNECWHRVRFQKAASSTKIRAVMISVALEVRQEQRRLYASEEGELAEA